MRRHRRRKRSRRIEGPTSLEDLGTCPLGVASSDESAFLAAQISQDPLL